MPAINRGGHFLLTEMVKNTASQNRLTEAVKVSASQNRLTEADMYKMFASKN